jgi:hypothetical protein
MTQNLKTPFFAALLESQNRTANPENEAFTWHWTDSPTTLPGKDNLETHKYPSDNDEEGTSI